MFEDTSNSPNAYVATKEIIKAKADLLEAARQYIARAPMEAPPLHYVSDFVAAIINGSTSVEEAKATAKSRNLLLALDVKMPETPEEWEQSDSQYLVRGLILANGGIVVGHLAISEDGVFGNGSLTSDPARMKEALEQLQQEAEGEFMQAVAAAALASAADVNFAPSAQGDVPAKCLKCEHFRNGQCEKPRTGGMDVQVISLEDLFGLLGVPPDGNPDDPNGIN